MCGSIGPVVLFFSKALIHGFKLISPLKIIHFLVSDWSLTINFLFCGNLRATIGFQAFSWWQQRKTRQWTATPATTPLGGNKAARAEATRVTKVLVEARTSPTPKTDRRVNQTVASWRMASAAQGLQATPPTGDILACIKTKSKTLFNQKAPLSKYLSAANGFKPQLPRRSYASRWTPQPNTSTSASTTRMSSRCENVFVECQEKSVWKNVYFRRFLFLFLIFFRRFGQRERGEKVRIAQRSSNNSRWVLGLGLGW